jgi:hypothetical protein
MSSVPPEMPEVLDHAAPTQDAKRGMATAALVCGLLGLLSFCPFFVVLALLGVIFGIIALVRAANQPGQYTGRRPAIVGISCGAVGLLLMPASLATLSWLRTTSMRAVCTSNLKGIGTGMAVYANDYADWLPVSPFAQIEDPDPINATAVSFIGQMSANLTTESVGDGTAVHPSRSLFLIVIDGICTAKPFICPSSGDTEDNLRISVGTALPTSRRDFLGYPYLSYGYHLQYGTQARPIWGMLDPRMVIAADKGPYFCAGTPVGAEQRVPDAPLGQPGAKIVIPRATSEAQLRALRDKAWRPFNSRNHNGEGQSVLFADGSATFVRKPIVGANGDNIYTMQSGYTALDALLGQQPADFRGPLTNTDSVIVP